MRFNLSEWALRHRSLVVYAMLVLAIVGTLSYLGLGRSEDPKFTFKVASDLSATPDYVLYRTVEDAETALADPLDVIVRERAIRLEVEGLVVQHVEQAVETDGEPRQRCEIDHPHSHILL